MPSEITVIVKDEEKRLTKKHLIYEQYQVDENDPLLSQCIAETIKEFDGEPTDINVKINLVIK
jgi:hypothetical protein